MFKEKYGPWALIAGGSDGIGAAFARSLANRGVNLVLVARDPKKLRDLRLQIESTQPQIKVVAIPADLAKMDSVNSIAAATKELEIGCFVYNVGSEPTFGSFLSHDRQFVEGRTQRNIVAKTLLTHHFGGLMVPRKRGGIILMGSLSGYFGSPGFSLYAASKAYTRYLAEGLWYEFKKSNVHLLCPVVGVTATPTMLNAYGALSNASDPNHVAEEALGRLSQGPIWISDSIRDQVKYVEALSPGDRATLGAEWSEAFALQGTAPSA